MSDAPTKYCHACAAAIDARAEICPKCGVRQQGMLRSQTDPVLRKASSDKMMAGLCGIFLGAFGVHKFVLGFTTPGIILLAVTVLTCGIGSILTGPVGLIEGIIYLSRSDEDFYETYVVDRKEWF